MAEAFLRHGPVLRTPEERFAAAAADFPYPPRSLSIAGGGLRMAYVDVGPVDATPVLLLHGEPTWGYLYRTMIPPLVAAGYRCVVPDLIGFGRSDKPSSVEAYSYAAHVAALSQFIAALNLRGAVLFAQDWGGLLGLRVLADAPDRFAAAAVANTGLPDGSGHPSRAFLAWREYSQSVEELPVGRIVSGGCAQRLPPAVIAAYDAPFPTEAHKAGARIFPALVPTAADAPGAAENRAAWAALAAWPGRLVTLFSDGDPVTRGGARPFVERLPAAAGQPHEVIRGAGHFLQEDAGPEVAAAVVRWLAQLDLPRGGAGTPAARL